ncbi:NPC intracellular cholesterol transporter 1 1b [Chionoecetes opilio]|uniref:NPC intracellular cholesterol transporter 1 1b n=1 Tax=Chionoecetes opilio TaxID=41210 RepID=A0A8J4Y2Z4_CHIOP|nr:NPC intracellular cholesterol transporter 1 1b [Chionoecetes opilio]
MYCAVKTVTERSGRESVRVNSSSVQLAMDDVMGWCVKGTMKNKSEKRSGSHPSSVLGRISLGVVTGLEQAFYRYGCVIAKHPALFIFICLAITGVFSVGLMKFTFEERPFKLWIPQDSNFINVMNWQKENFPAPFRAHVALYEAENVLDRNVLLEMLRVHEAVARTSTPKATWPSVCAKLPSIPDSLFGRKRRSANQSVLTNVNRLQKQRVKRDQDEEGIDWSVVLSRGQYCGFLEGISQECMEHSILEVWGYDWDYISTLEPLEIIEDINTADKSAVFGFPTNFTEMLGGVERDREGRVIKARAARQLWVTRINFTAVSGGDFADDTGTGMEVDTASFEWEKEFIKTVLNETERPDNVSLYLMASSSFGMISGDTILGDAQYLGIGFMVVFVYIQVMLGRFNLVEQRPILSLMGLTCVGMAIFVSYGLCSAFNIPFGPVNNVLPFLLLGLGIDDMFVIMQAWNNLTPREKTLELTERVGIALKHAGVSITVTSLTDFAAFAIGSGTVLPALRSFCLYAAVGIAAVYFFQATFFVAWFSLDQRRLEDNRQGILWCWKVKNWTPNRCSQKELCQSFFSDIYAKYLLKLPVKIVVLLLTAILLSVSSWGLSNLRQDFNPIWFLPQSSYLFKFFMKNEQYFPSAGEEGIIYFGEINMTSELPKIEALMLKLNASESISSIDSWYLKYKKYWEKQGYFVPDSEETEEEFLDQLGMFLYSPSGSRYRVKNFVFDSSFGCTDLATQVLASSVEFKHKVMSESREQIRAMDEVKAIVSNSNISGYVQTFARAYSGWETNQIIEKELYHNMGLAMLVVFLVTLVLIANISASIMVLVCVVFTLVDVAALMHWWGLTIDTVSCIDLVLAIGLCVDYAAHVAHTFMTKTGSRDERARQAVATIGPAVLNGGFSTFLAFIFLANSDSHVFITFFKIFFGVVLYGLFHGLVFLPVLLSLLGPSAYPSAGLSPQHKPHEVEELCSQPPLPLHNQEIHEEMPTDDQENSTIDTKRPNSESL